MIIVKGMIIVKRYDCSKTIWL